MCRHGVNLVMDEHSLAALRQRLGDEHLGRRLRIQVDRITQITGHGKGSLHYESIPLFIGMVGLFLRLTGLYSRGYKNALSIRVRQNSVMMPGLPKAFDGLRILHLSDLHLDGHQGFGALIAEKIHGLEFDLCVLTGDFRFYEMGRYEHIASELDDLLPALQCRYGVYGILGNHDFIEMAPMLEASGVHLLINESVALVNGEDTIWLVGLDDAHLYGLHDLEKGLADVPADGARILLVHSPEIIPEAAAKGFGLYLSGHTHAGQICLPGGRPLYLNARSPRRFTYGPWQYERMNGFTSAGVGSSGVFVRYFCPPEIAVHTLHCADAPSPDVRSVKITSGEQTTSADNDAIDRDLK